MTGLFARSIRQVPQNESDKRPVRTYAKFDMCADVMNAPLRTKRGWMCRLLPLPHLTGKH